MLKVNFYRRNCKPLHAIASLWDPAYWFGIDSLRACVRVYIKAYEIVRIGLALKVYVLVSYWHWSLCFAFAALNIEVSSQGLGGGDSDVNWIYTCGGGGTCKMFKIFYFKGKMLLPGSHGSSLYTYVRHIGGRWHFSIGKLAVKKLKIIFL